MSTHLKPEQFNDLLLGITEAETSAHLGACPQCRAEIEAMRQTLGSFRVAAVNWSEGTARQVPVPSKQRRRPLWTRSAWVLVTAAVLLAAVVSLSVWRGHSNDTVATANAQAQIARDNQLLADIQSDIGETTPVFLQPLQVNH